MLVERVGRKPLLLGGNAVFLLANVTFLVVFKLNDDAKVEPILPFLEPQAQKREGQAEGRVFDAAAYVFLVGSAIFMASFCLGPGTHAFDSPYHPGLQRPHPIAIICIPTAVNASLMPSEFTKPGP